MRRPSCLVSLLVLVVVVVLATAGAGSAKVHGNVQLTKVRVGLVPFNSTAPTILGVKKGFFAREGLDVEVVPLQSGPVIMAAVVSGSIDLGGAAGIVFLSAAGQGLPIRAVAVGNHNRRGQGGVLVRRDSPIRRAKDLEGKTVAVLGLRTGFDLAVRAWVKRGGGDHTKINFVTLPLQAQLAALEAGRVDAVSSAPPFLQEGLRAGHRSLGDAAVVFGPRATIGLLFTATSTIEQKAGLVQRFVRASNRAAEYADKHPREVRAVLPSWTGVPENVARVTPLPLWGGGIKLRSLQRQADFAFEFGYSPVRPDVRTLVWRGARIAKRG